MSDVLGITELGMINDVNRLNVISNNLANVNTTGFKREIPVSRAFESTLLNQLNSAGVSIDGQKADASKTTQNVIDQSTGLFKYTGNKFDVAIEGEGFFEVSNKEGTFYTRQGTLSIDPTGRLTTSGGHVLNGTAGDITVTSHEPLIDKQGRVWEGENQIGQLKVVSFTKPQLLQKVGAGLYRANNIAAEVMNEKSVRVRQGYLESSNVVMMNEMVNMIEVMRHFETSQRLIKSYDEMLDNTIRTLGDF